MIQLELHDLFSSLPSLHQNIFKKQKENKTKWIHVQIVDQWFGGKKYHKIFNLNSAIMLIVELT